MVVATLIVYSVDFAKYFQMLPPDFRPISKACFRQHNLSIFLLRDYLCVFSVKSQHLGVFFWHFLCLGECWRTYQFTLDYCEVKYGQYKMWMSRMSIVMMLILHIQQFQLLKNISQLCLLKRLKNKDLLNGNKHCQCPDSKYHFSLKGTRTPQRNS